MNRSEAQRATNEAIRDQMLATLRESDYPLSAKQLARKMGLRSSDEAYRLLTVLRNRGQIIRHSREDRAGMTTFAAIAVALVPLDQLPPLVTNDA